MNTLDEPEGGRGSMPITTIQVLNNAGYPWKGSRIEHNFREYRVGNATGEVRLYVNGGAIRLNGVPITGIIQKGVENIIQHNSQTGTFKRVIR